MSEIQMTLIWLSAYTTTVTAKARGRRRDERGAMDLTTIVILTAIGAAGAIAVGAIIVKKVTDTANSIPTK